MKSGFRGGHHGKAVCAEGCDGQAIRTVEIADGVVRPGITHGDWLRDFGVADGNFVVGDDRCCGPLPLAVFPTNGDAFEFFAIIGDGGPAAGSGVVVPLITGYDLHSGTPFASNFQPEVTTSGGDGVIQAYISTATGSVSIAPGIMPIATLTIDTTGFQVGDDPWILALQSFTMGISSQLVRLGEPVAAELLSGEMTLAAVPEPAPMAVAAGLGLLGFALWRRHRSA